MTKVIQELGPGLESFEDVSTDKFAWDFGDKCDL